VRCAQALLARQLHAPWPGLQRGSGDTAHRAPLRRGAGAWALRPRPGREGRPGVGRRREHVPRLQGRAAGGGANRGLHRGLCHRPDRAAHAARARPGGGARRCAPGGGGAGRARAARQGGSRMITRLISRMMPLHMDSIRRVAVLVAMLWSATPTRADGEPRRAGPLTDPDRVVAMQPADPPRYLAPVSDSVFGVRLIRSTDAPGRPVSAELGPWGPDARHVYSKQQPWNATGTLL